MSVLTCESVEIPDCLKEIVEIQDILDNVDENNCENSISSLKKILINDKTLISVFLDIFLTIANGRMIPSIPFFHVLIEITKIFKDEIIPLIFKSNHWYTKRILFDNGIISRDQIKQDNANKSHSVLQGSYHHSPLLASPTFSITEELGSPEELKWIDLGIEPSELLKDDKKLLKEYYKYLYPSDSIFHVIQNDDVDTLQEMSTKVGFSFNNAIKCLSIATGHSQIIDLIRHSMRCGSVKCFKFLLLNHADANDFSFAFSGGNIEIIRSLYNNTSIEGSNNSIKTQEWLKNALMAHHNDIVDWLYINNIANSISTSFLCSCNNYRAFLLFISNEYDVYKPIYSDFTAKDNLRALQYFFSDNKLNDSEIQMVLKQTLRTKAVTVLNYMINVKKVEFSRNTLSSIFFSQFVDEIFPMIMDHCPEIDEKGNDGQTFLNSALTQGAFDIAKKLILSGKCDINSADNWLQTPLHHAAFQCDKCDIELIKLLLDMKADPNSKDKDNNTPSHFAAMRSKNSSVLHLLFDYGADFSVLNNTGDNLLHSAARGYGSVEVMKFILDHCKDINVNQTNIYGTTPLHTISSANLIDCAKFLLSRGADPTIPDKCGKTSIDIAYSKELTDLLQNALQPKKRRFSLL